MKNIKKIMIILLLVTIFICLNTVIFGVDNPDAYTPETMSDKDSEKIGNITGDILATIRAVGAIGAIVILSIIGLKYIFSSVEEKAEYKQTIAPYVIGCVLLVSATTIPSMVYDLAYTEGDVGFKSPQDISETATGIVDGKVNVKELSNQKIKELYSREYIGDDLRAKTTSDPRAQGKDNIMTLTEAINSLSTYKREIYNEAKARGLLKEDGISLK